MEIIIINFNGEVVCVINVGIQVVGNIEFNWDGIDSSGNIMLFGDYVVSVVGEVNGEGVVIFIVIYCYVSSVSLVSSSQGIILNLEGDVSINFSDVI